MTKEKLEKVNALSDKERYDYFVRNTVNFEIAWSLKDDNDHLVMFGTEDGHKCVPVLPEKTNAELLISDEWSNLHLCSYSLNEFEELLTKFNDEEIKLAVFPTPDLSALVVSAKTLLNHLKEECKLYK